MLVFYYSAMEDTDPRRGNCATFNVSENTGMVWQTFFYV